MAAGAGTVDDGIEALARGIEDVRERARAAGPGGADQALRDAVARLDAGRRYTAPREGEAPQARLQRVRRKVEVLGEHIDAMVEYLWEVGHEHVDGLLRERIEAVAGSRDRLLAMIEEAGG